MEKQSWKRISVALHEVKSILTHLKDVEFLVTELQAKCADSIDKLNEIIENEQETT